MNNYFIAYFPYIGLKDTTEIDLGFGKIWNFDKMKDAYIKNPELLKKVEKIVDINTELWSKRVQNVGIISIGSTNFRKFNDKENELIRQIRLILFISFIAKNNTVINHVNAGLSMATAENFDVVYQNFTIDGESFSESSGEIVNINASGYRFSEVKFQKPRYILNPFKFNLDLDIVRGMLELKRSKPRIFLRIINAIQLLMEGYYNTPYLSRNARLLLHAGAFEVLLSLPDIGQRKELKKKIKDITVFNGEKEYSYWTKIGPKNVKLKGSVKEIWADQFYTLRNNIIHGNNPNIKKFIFNKTQNHLDISILFFVLLIKKQIEKSLGKKYECDYEIQWDEWEDQLISKNKIQGFVYSMSMRKLFDKLKHK